MEIEIEQVEKESCRKEKVNKKQYFYAIEVIVIAGLFLGGATHIPIGPQFLVPSLNSISYFFGSGHGGQPFMIWYITQEHASVWDAFVATAIALSLSWILDYIGIDAVTGIDAEIISSSQLLSDFLVEMFWELLPWWLGPVAIGYAIAFAYL